MKHSTGLWILAVCCLTGGCRQVLPGEQGVALDRERTPPAPLAAHAPIATQAGDASTTNPGSPVDAPKSYGNAYGVRPDYQDCITHQPDDASTAGHRQDCADQEFDFQDARLNRSYRQALTALGQGTAASMELRDAQRQWLSQLDKKCAEAALQAGSTMGPAAQSTCLMDTTAKRADDLEKRYPEAVK